jgi:WD40 repeat protein
VNRGFVESERLGLEPVIWEKAEICLTFVHRHARCVSVACTSGMIYVYNLESGDLVRELDEERACLTWCDDEVVDTGIGTMAVAGEGCAVKQEDERSVVDRVWLVAGHHDGSVRIWNLETERFLATLHPIVGLHCSTSHCISIAPDRVVSCISRIQDATAQKKDYCMYGIYHPMARERYELVHGCQDNLGFEVASAALHQDATKRNVELCNSRAVRFEQSGALNERQKRSSSKPHSVRSRVLDCLASKENRRSRCSGSVQSMRVEDELAASVGESKYLECSPIANCGACVLVAAMG